MDDVETLLQQMAPIIAAHDGHTGSGTYIGNAAHSLSRGRKKLDGRENNDGLTRVAFDILGGNFPWLTIASLKEALDSGDVARTSDMGPKKIEGLRAILERAEKLRELRQGMDILLALQDEMARW